MVKPPKIAAIRLPALAPGDIAQLGIEATCDGLEFAGVDFTGLDLHDGALTDCRLAGASGAETAWRRAHLTSCVIERATLAGLDAAGGSWRGVSMTDSRLGSLDGHDGRLESVRLVGCRLGYVNLRHATLKDVEFERCRIDDLDLLESAATRVRFSQCEIGALNLHLAKLIDVDLTGASLGGIIGVEYLRGAAISAEQLLDLAGPIAAALGVEVVE